MDKQAIYDFFNSHGINFEITDHGEVFDMSGLESVSLPYPGNIAKNLLVSDDKNCEYYMITVRGKKRVDLKEFRKRYSTRKLSLADDSDLFRLLGAKPGAVSPLGLLNDEKRKVKLFIDNEFLEGDAIIGVHPNDNASTVWLNIHDLIALITEHGNDVRVVGINE